jgi:hypothetical protein
VFRIKIKKGHAQDRDVVLLRTYVYSQALCWIPSKRSFSRPPPPLRCKIHEICTCALGGSKWEPFGKGDVVTKWFSYAHVRISLRNAMAAAAVKKIYSWLARSAIFYISATVGARHCYVISRHFSANCRMGIVWVGICRNRKWNWMQTHRFNRPLVKFPGMTYFRMILVLK